MPVNTIITCVIVVLLLGAIVYLTVLLIRALRKYILSKEVRQEKKRIGANCLIHEGLVLELEERLGKENVVVK